MKQSRQLSILLRRAVPAIVLAGGVAGAQQTLGSLNGSVSDATGALIVGAKVTLTGDQNGIKQTTTTKKNGLYQFQNLPVGVYTLAFTQTGFETSQVPAIQVQADRTGTVNIELKAGSEGSTITVNAQPLLDQTDATNGYVLDARTIQETPLATGSFTQLAVLAPGVSGELLRGIGTNAGLGNEPIFANGQRDTSNGFQVNGVDVTNLFNGKSSSQSDEGRLGFNIGQQAGNGGENQTNTSVFGSNGQGLATPPPEFIQEISVNTSQYDAAQGNRSGAQVSVDTATGNNQFHGSFYGTRATNFANAGGYFNKQTYFQNLTAQQNLQAAATSTPAQIAAAVNATAIAATFIVPQLHRDVIGGTASGPLIRNKVFFFLGYQHQHDSDALKGLSQILVPSGLSDDRSTTGLTTAINSFNTASTANGAATTTFNGTFDPVAVALLQQKLADGTFLIPSAQSTLTPGPGSYNVALLSKSIFKADQAYGGLDYNVNARDRISAKYYYQHDPVVSPFTNANTLGYPAAEDAGAQVGALSNTLTIGSKINWEQRFGFSRQKVYSTFNPAFPNSTFGIGFPGGNGLPGISLGNFAYQGGGAVTLGPNSTFANAGYFQNRWNPQTSIIFSIGGHNLSAGTSYNYTQLNVRNRRVNQGTLATANFVTFVEGQVSSSSELLGSSNRYYRANEIGAYVQDQWKPLSNLSITAGIRYDYDGGFSEKYGNIFNFEPTLFSVTQSTVINDGFVVAGNNAFSPTANTSNSTLTGRQWGISPRLGFAYTPKENNGKVVFRGSFGTYYDRGELFSYLSQPAGGGSSGPFGVTTAAPLVNSVTGAGTRTLENPLGSAVIPVSSSDPSTFAKLLPTANALRAGCAGLAVEMSGAGASCGVTTYNFGAYARDNKLPYTIAFAFNVQVQLASDTALTVGYTGNRDRHLVIPVPFNQPQVATPGAPINGETNSYGYEVLNTASPNGKFFNPISTEPYSTPTGGNTDLRVPYVGYNPNATLFKAAGIGAYDALETHLEKKFNRNISAGVSYTFGHALDEQSDIGLFFTGDNPNRLRDSYASSDFDRTNVLVFNYLFRLPNYRPESSLIGKFTDGWQITGITRLQSGQAFSLYDFSGAVGSLYFGNNSNVADPVIAIKDGKHPNSARTGAQGTQYTIGAAGTQYYPTIDPSQLSVNFIAPGQKGVPTCNPNEPCDIFESDFTPGQRNLFRQSFQKDADVSIQKITRFHERYSARYALDIYNITNTSSFDLPKNNISVSQGRYAPTGFNVGNAQVATSVATNQADQNNLYIVPGVTVKPGTNTLLKPTGLNNTFGAIRNVTGQPRTIEMSLHLNF